MSTSSLETQTTYSHLRRKDEPVEQWMQRVLEPFDGNFDQQVVLDRIRDITNKRNERNAQLEREFHELCEKLQIWATARPVAAHFQEVDQAEKRVQAAKDELQAQEYLIDKLRGIISNVRATLIMEPVNMILDDMDRQSSAQEQAGSNERRPVVLVADSSQ